MGKAGYVLYSYSEEGVSVSHAAGYSIWIFKVSFFPSDIAQMLCPYRLSTWFETVR